MKIFFIVLENFILKLFFHKDEYDIKNKNFNPVKAVVMAILITNNILGVYFFTKTLKLYNLIEKECPGAIEGEINKNKQSTINTTTAKK
jgi:hypothetical protein